MSIVLVGMSHHTAPLSVREPVTFSADRVAEALELLRRSVPDAEAMLLSTCNRTEVALIHDAAESHVQTVVRVLAQVSGVSMTSFEHYLYRFVATGAIRHLFRVAAGLDSLALGEHHIVKQLKQAHSIAHDTGLAGPVLHRLVASALRTSARVRRDTNLGAGRSTVPSVAVEMARAAVHDLREKQVLVIGAGAMAQSVSRQLRSAGTVHLTVMSRTLTHAQTLATRCQGRALPYDQLMNQLARADVVVTTMRSPAPILSVDTMQSLQDRRCRRPLLILDLAVPRNVEAGVGRLDHVTLCDIDTFGQIASANREARQRVVPQCERIVNEQVQRFQEWLAHARQGPLLGQLYHGAHGVRDAELRWLEKNGPTLSPAQQQAVVQMTHRLMKKLLHPIASTICRDAQSCDHEALHEVIHALHDIALRCGAGAGEDGGCPRDDVHAMTQCRAADAASRPMRVQAAGFDFATPVPLGTGCESIEGEWT